MAERLITEGKLAVLHAFFDNIHADSRVTTAHISLFFALWTKWLETREKQTIIFFTRDIMPLSKISSVSTYHKAIKQLGEYGYINYEPSFNHNVGSTVAFFNPDKN